MPEEAFLLLRGILVLKLLEHRALLLRRLQFLPKLYLSLGIRMDEHFLGHLIVIGGLEFLVRERASLEHPGLLLQFPFLQVDENLSLSHIFLKDMIEYILV